MALRTLSMELGFFTESEKGRQQFAIKRTVGENIFNYGYCVAAYAVSPECIGNRALSGNIYLKIQTMYLSGLADM